MKVNLGCGTDYLKDFINCDINPDCAGIKPDMIIDIEKKLPFEDNSVDFVYARQIFEHIRNFVELMIEIHRILNIGGKLEVSVPLFPCKASIADPDHIRFFVPESFVMFCNPGLHPYFRGAGLFEVDEYKTGYHAYPDMTEQESRDFFTELVVTMTKVKWIKSDDGQWIKSEK